MVKSRSLQFGIGSLLFLLAIVAGYFTGLTRGDRVRNLSTVSTKIYAVDDLLSRASGNTIEEDLESIIAIVKDIVPGNWDSPGPSIEPSKANASIVVTNKNEVHEDIASLFVALRKGVKKGRQTDRVSYKTYSVGDLVDPSLGKPTEDQLKTLCDMIAKNVQRHSWYGPFDLSTNSEGLSISVSAPQSTHARLQEYLDGLRNAKIRGT